MTETPKRRPRRRFDEDFKAQAVRVVLDEGKSVGSVARDLDLTETALREWVKRARADRTHGKAGLTTAEREELARLRKENRILREEREILKKGGSLLRERAVVKFRFIAAEKAHHSLTVVPLPACDAQRVLRLATTARIGAGHPRPPVEGAGARASCAGSKERYGSPRIHRDLLEDHQERVSRKRVIRLMQEDGLKARLRKRFKCTTMSDHDQPVAANLLDRQFTAAAPDQRWVGDTTEFVIGERGKLYLAAILDCSHASSSAGR
jgi:transposase